MMPGCDDDDDYGGGVASLSERGSHLEVGPVEPLAVIIGAGNSCADFLTLHLASLIHCRKREFG